MGAAAAYAQRVDVVTEPEGEAMSTSGPAGPAGRMLIARGLVALRERSGLTQTQAAQSAGCGKATVGRYETWQDRAKVKWATVKALAEACDASEEERDALVELARSQGEGWWVGNKAVPEWMDPLVSFEEAGEYEHVFANCLVPGLLQTRAYALALYQAQLTEADPEIIGQEVDARMKRQDILKRQSPAFRLWAVLDEAVLRRVVGTHAVMAEQIDHLLTVAKQPGIEVQVLPFRSGAHAAGAGQPFVTIGRDDEHRPLNSMAVVYLEMHNRGIYLDDPDDVASYKRIFDYLRSQAADTTTSASLMTAARQEYFQ